MWEFAKFLATKLEKITIGKNKITNLMYLSAIKLRKELQNQIHHMFPKYFNKKMKSLLWEVLPT